MDEFIKLTTSQLDFVVILLNWIRKFDDTTDVGNVLFQERICDILCEKLGFERDDKFNYKLVIDTLEYVIKMRGYYKQRTDENALEQIFLNTLREQYIKNYKNTEVEYITKTQTVN